MQGLLVVACIALFLCFASAQNVVCNTTFTEICLKSTQSCPGTNSGDVESFCSEGTACSGGACTALPLIGAACSSLPCWDPNYTGIVCSSSVCSWTSLYGPGEACATSTASNPYVNGGCLTGLTCSSGVCTSVGAGTACNNGACNAGLFCNTTSGNCQARLASGTICGGNVECVETTICTSRGGTAAPTCQTPFVGAAGASCDSVLDCQANLYCSETNSQCTALPTDGQTCTDDASCPNSIQFCECTAKTKSISNGTITTEEPPVCVNGETVITSSEISAYNSFQSCAVSKKCFDVWSSEAYGFGTGGAIEAGGVTGPNQCQFSCGGASTFGFAKLGLKFNSCSAGSAAVSLKPLFALLMLVFIVAALL